MRGDAANLCENQGRVPVPRGAGGTSSPAHRLAESRMRTGSGRLASGPLGTELPHAHGLRTRPILLHVSCWKPADGSLAPTLHSLLPPLVQLVHQSHELRRRAEWVEIHFELQ